MNISIFKRILVSLMEDDLDFYLFNKRIFAVSNNNL